MTRFVTFGGSVAWHPGGLSRVDATGLTPTNLTSTGIVGLIGEADGGTPGEIITVDDPSLALATFRSGPLADAIRIAFDPSDDPRIPGGAFRCICYKVNDSTQSDTQLPGDETLLAEVAGVGSTTTVLVGTALAVTLNQHAGRWISIPSLSQKRRIISNTASPAPTYTVAPGFASAIAAATVFNVLNSEMLLTSTEYGTHANQLTVEFEAGSVTSSSVITLSDGSTTEQSPDIGGTPYLVLQYFGGPIPANGSGTITAATISTITLDVAAAPALNAFAGMVLQFSDGTQRLILSNTAADPTVITLAVGHEITAAQAVDFVGTAATVHNVTSATASITGTFGTAKTLVSVVAPTADNLAITFSTNQTLRNLVDFINTNTNYRAQIPDGINGDTTLMNTFDFGTRATLVDVRFDQGILPDTNGNFRRDLQVAVDWINTFATLATAVRATAGSTEGAEIPEYTGGAASSVQDVFIGFVNGSRGNSANSDWQTGFDLFLEQRINHVVPLISYDLVADGFGSSATFTSIAAQLSSHVEIARTIAKSERGGYIGGQLTKAQLLAQAAALNNTDVQVSGQKISALDVSGTLTEMPEWAFAVAQAGMRSGAPEIGEPLTFKFLKTSSLTQSTTWSPRNRTDINQLLAGGVLFAEQIVTGGFRIVRDITTYLIDANIAFTSGSTRDTVRFISYDLRTGLEDQFTGLKATPATVAGIRDFVTSKMALYLLGGLIVESLDPETQSQIVPGFRRLRVRIDGDIAYIDVEIFPVVEIAFQLTSITLQLPRLVA